MIIYVGICLILSSGVKVVSPCYQRWCNNLNEPLHPFPFLVAAEQRGGQG